MKSIYIDSLIIINAIEKVPAWIAWSVIGVLAIAIVGLIVFAITN